MVILFDIEDTVVTEGKSLDEDSIRNSNTNISSSFSFIYL